MVWSCEKNGGDIFKAKDAGNGATGKEDEG